MLLKSGRTESGTPIKPTKTGDMVSGNVKSSLILGSLFDKSFVKTTTAIVFGRSAMNLVYLEVLWKQFAGHYLTMRFRYNTLKAIRLTKNLLKELAVCWD